jgi:hypothetical protein
VPNPPIAATICGKPCKLIMVSPPPIRYTLHPDPNARNTRASLSRVPLQHDDEKEKQWLMPP